MNDDLWELYLAAWIIQDGNYGDFVVGSRAELAVEFYGPGAVVRGGGGGRFARRVDDARYAVEGIVTAVADNAWAADFGIGAYANHPPDGLAVGDRVAGVTMFGVDHYFYFEVLARRPDFPPLVYEWEVERIRIETAPFIPGSRPRELVRDESRRGYADLERTDDDGSGEYILDLRLDPRPPKSLRS